MPAESWDRERFHDYVSERWGEDEAPGVILVVERWIARGDGAAVYENHDLGHPDVGMPKIASYGSPAAQLETDTPPERLPDTLKDINWRYQLVAVYREEVNDERGEEEGTGRDEGSAGRGGPD